VSLANLTGFTSEEARLANLEVGGLSLRGLLLAGIIIGGLGVLDDVTMSQSSTVFELHRANPRATFGELLRGGLNVGRDHIAATVNTLFLAYAGAALPLLILFVTADAGLGTVVTAEIVAVEVVRTLVGSVGLVAAVPLTTALAAAVVASADPAAAPRPRPGRAAREPGAGFPPPRADDRPADEPGAGFPPPRREHRAAGEAGAGFPPPRAEQPVPPPAEPAAADEPDDDWEARLRAAYRLDDRDDRRR
jgi:uncharacterized membrane protein